MPRNDPRPQRKRKTPKKGARCGTELKQRLTELRTPPSEKLALGQRVWVKVTSYCDWPGVIWSIDLCLKKIVPELVHSYTPGSVLVRFYGDQSSMFCKKSNIKLIDDDYDRRYRTLKQWGKQDKKRDQKATWALEDLDTSVEDYEAEIQRMLQLQSNLLNSKNGDGILCALCEEDGAQMKCAVCERYLHSLCLTPAALMPEDIPDGGQWLCPSCGEENQVNKDPVESEEEKIERMGLTPDWIIHAAAFKVFQLPQPTADFPYIRGLLDPCTNSKIAPNIPAEVLYDKNDDGLKLSNAWKGYFIVLNPDFKAHIQWRFVNRAIDEVENDSVPGVLLICRNSTDTAYFQRLLPYPRVLLRRNSIRFKDYDKTPIGFGIVVFCIVKHDYHKITGRFFEYFAPFGEPNVVIDKSKPFSLSLIHEEYVSYLMSASFESLLGRLYTYANTHHRDHWVQCCRCEKWRIVGYEALLNAKHTNWECKDLNPPYSSCATIQTKAEMHGARYAILSEDKGQHFMMKDASPNKELSAEYSTQSLPPEVLCQLQQMKLVREDSTLDATSTWQACSYTLSMSEGSFPSSNGEMPSNHQLKALSQALTAKILQCAPNMKLPEDGFVIKPVIVDNETYGAVIQWMKTLAAQPPSPMLPLKRLPEPSSSKAKTKIAKTGDAAPPKKTTEVLTARTPVKSGLELERELNKAAHRRLMDSLYHSPKGPDNSSLQVLDLKEAESMFQKARQQLTGSTLHSERITAERIKLEEALEKRRQDCDEEYLQAECEMRTLQARLDTYRETKGSSM